MLRYICVTKCLKNMAKRLLFLFLIAASFMICKAADDGLDQLQGSYNLVQIEMNVGIIGPYGDSKRSFLRPYTSSDNRHAW